MESFTIPDELQCIQCETDEYFITDHKEGNIVCTSCGMIAESRIVSQSKDWNNYDDGVDKSRCSAIDESNPYASCGSYIPANTFVETLNADGKKIKVDLSKLQIRITYSSKQRSFDVVAKEFSSLSDIGVSQRVINTAKVYWGEIMDKGIHRGAIRKGIIASCIVYSCYANNCAMSRKEVSDLMQIKKEDITNGEHIFMGMISKTKYKDILKLTSNIADMFERNLSDFGLSTIKYSHTKKCLAIYNQFSDKFINMKPESVVGGIITFVLKEQEKMKKPSKGKICEVIGVSNPTINKTLNFVKELIEKEKQKLNLTNEKQKLKATETISTTVFNKKKIIPPKKIIPN